MGKKGWCNWGLMVCSRMALCTVCSIEEWCRVEVLHTMALCTVWDTMALCNSGLKACSRLASSRENSTEYSMFREKCRYQWARCSRFRACSKETCMCPLACSTKENSTSVLCNLVLSTVCSNSVMCNLNQEAVCNMSALSTVCSNRVWNTVLACSR